MKTFFLQDSFIIDQNGRAIWVWVGKAASKKERIESIRNAHGFGRKKKYAPSVPVTRVVEHGEPVEFKALFHTWRDPDEVVKSYNQYSSECTNPGKLYTLFDWDFRNNKWGKSSLIQNVALHSKPMNAYILYMQT